MKTLEDVAKDYYNTVQKESIDEFNRIYNDLLSSPNIVTYPIDIFNNKFYLPLRAFCEFKIDTIALASKLKNGEVRSSLFRDWMSICVLPTNKVALVDRNNNDKIITIIPELSNTFIINDVNNYTNVNFNTLLQQGMERYETKRIIESHQYFQEVGEEIKKNFVTDKSAILKSIEETKKALDEVDKFFKIDSRKRIDVIRKSIPAEYLNENKEVKNNTINNDLDAFL